MAERDKSRPYGWRNINYKHGKYTSVYVNKLNKKAVLSMHTANICRRVVVR